LEEIFEGFDRFLLVGGQRGREMGSKGHGSGAGSGLKITNK
jgi:hypothetical protein